MRSLSLKLILAFVAVSLIGAVLASLFARWITEQEFNRLVMEQVQSNFMSEVMTYYTSRGSWAGVTEYFRQKAQSPQLQPRPANPNNPQPLLPREQDSRQSAPVPIILIDQNGYVLHPVPPYRAGDFIAPEKLVQGIPVVINGKMVGTILALGSAPPLSEQEQQYLDRTNQAIFVSALVALMIALVLSIILARTLTRPLRELANAIRAMAKGKLGVAVPVRSRDEIGELTTAFNQMSADLARSNQLRKQMTADIAHDLRTPLTVIGGYIESLRDGVLEANPDRLDVMHQEVQHLQRLVEDLRTLSLADSDELKLNRQRIPPQTLLEQTTSSFKQQAEQKQIALRAKAEARMPEINVDEVRIAQVLGNLVSNALRYTSAGGEIMMSARRESKQIVLSVQDNGVGIAPDALPHIFERFYRADSARQSESESGLGLAIAKSLVEAHGGTITAMSEGHGKGSVFSIRLPE